MGAYHESNGGEIDGCAIGVVESGTAGVDGAVVALGEVARWEGACTSLTRGGVGEGAELRRWRWRGHNGRGRGESKWWQRRLVGESGAGCKELEGAALVIASKRRSMSGSEGRTYGARERGVSRPRMCTRCLSEACKVHTVATRQVSPLAHVTWRKVVEWEVRVRGEGTCSSRGRVHVEADRAGGPVRRGLAAVGAKTAGRREEGAEGGRGLDGAAGT